MKAATKICLMLLALLAASPARAWTETVREEVVKKPRKKPKLTRAPKLLKFVKAVYPPSALKAGLQASVELMITLDKKGAVTRAKVTRPAGRGFDEAALAALRQFKFSPAEVDGKPSPIQIVYVYNFTITKVKQKVKDTEAGHKGISISGRIREAGSRLGVSGAAVSIVGKGISVTAKKKGRYRIRGLVPGKYQLTASSPEHKQLTAWVVVKKGKTTKVTLYLESLRVNPYETIVRGKRQKQVVTRYTIQRRELVTVPGTFGDPLRVVQNLPGTARAPGGVGMLIIRGATPRDSKSFIDGIEVPLLYHFLGGPSILNSELLKKIDYYPGNFNARYGNATAGIIDVTTRHSSPEKWRGSAMIDLLNAGLYLEGPIYKNLSFSVSGRRSYIDAFLPLILKAAGVKSTTVVPFYWDYQAKLDLKLKNDDRLTLFGFGSYDSLRIVDTDPQSAEDLTTIGTQISFHRVLFRWLTHLSSKVTFVLQPYYGYGATAGEFQDVRFDFDQNEVGGRAEFRWRPMKRLSFTGGVEAQYLYQNASTRIPAPTETLWPGTWADMMTAMMSLSDDLKVITRIYHGFSFMPYVSAVLNVGGGVQIIPGFRALYNYFNGGDRFRLDPRLIVRWTVRKGTVLKLGAGLYSRYPDNNFLDHEFGNPNLPAIWAEQYGLGIEQKLTKHLTVDLQGFYISRHNVPYTSNNYIGEGAERKREWFAPTGLAQSFGLELLVKHRMTKYFYGWLSYTLSKSTRKNRSDLEWEAAPFDQTHIMTLVSSFRPGRGWELGIRFRLVTGNPQKPVIGSVFDGDGQRYRAIRGIRGGTRAGTFHQLDFRVEKKWTFKLWKFSLYLDIQNIYNASNEEAIRWDYRYKFSAPLPSLPFLATLGVKGSF